MMKILFGFFALAYCGLLFFYAGKWIDVTEKPVKADIIVCLGGGSPERVQKSVSLYAQGYSKSNLLLLIGENRDNKSYVVKYHPEMEFIANSDPKNTMEEVLFIKKYMKEHDFKSALIITDPPHSRRISLLTSMISIEDDENMTFRIVDSGVKWWDKDNYYKNKRARGFVMQEIVKIPYNVIAYSIFDNTRLRNDIKKLWDKIKIKGLQIE